LSLASTDSSRAGFYKSNPVNKFHEYKKLWDKQKMPGEKNHNDLRWAIREQMLSKDVIVKRQHKAYEPNGYAIPTDKKRQQLRWAVRNALANQF
jgi:hydrolethalus syndrome protein 1